MKRGSRIRRPHKLFTEFTLSGSCFLGKYTVAPILIMFNSANGLHTSEV